jgi:hypothetical protein
VLFHELLHQGTGGIHVTAFNSGPDCGHIIAPLYKVVELGSHATLHLPAQEPGISTRYGIYGDEHAGKHDHHCRDGKDWYVFFHDIHQRIAYAGWSDTYSMFYIMLYKIYQ